MAARVAGAIREVLEAKAGGGVLGVGNVLPPGAGAGVDGREIQAAAQEAGCARLGHLVGAEAVSSSAKQWATTSSHTAARLCAALSSTASHPRGCPRAGGRRRRRRRRHDVGGDAGPGQQRLDEEVVDARDGDMELPADQRGHPPDRKPHLIFHSPTGGRALPQVPGRLPQAIRRQTTSRSTGPREASASSPRTLSRRVTSGQPPTSISKFPVHLPDDPKSGSLRSGHRVASATARSGRRARSCFVWPGSSASARPVTMPRRDIG